MNRFLILLAPALALTGCATANDATPSLLPRAAEKQTFDEPALAAAPVVAADPVLDAKIATLLSERKRALAEFAAADARAAAVIAAGGKAAEGSDAWLDAQTAIGSLDAERAAILDVQTDLEQLAIARATDGQPVYPPLEAAQAETDAELTRLAATLKQRKAALPL